MKSLEQIIDEIIAKEGGYVNDPADSGGETMYGITAAVARANGYHGHMTDLPLVMARRIYASQYHYGPKFDRVGLSSVPISIELTDTGVNMGPQVAAEFLQRCLNAFNAGGTRWPDLPVDGLIGPSTLDALGKFMQWRGREGEQVMLKALNCLQGARYLTIAEKNQKNEAFVYGWINARIALPTEGEAT